MSIDHVESVELEAWEKPDFAQAVFLNVAESYPIDVHVECCYEIRPSLEATTRDWIGLFKVGWITSLDYTYFHWVKTPDEYSVGKQANCRVLFMCHTLPKDDGEYYQFCYVSQRGLVRGASTPFQFRRPGSNDFVTRDDDESDIVFITTKTDAIEEKLNGTLVKLNELENINVDLMTGKQALEAQIRGLTEELGNLQEKNEILMNEKQDVFFKIEVMKSEVADMTQAQDTLQDRVVFVTKEKEEILKRLEENEVYIKALQGKIKLLLGEKDALTGKQKSLEEERELYKSHFTTSEGTIQSYLHEVSELKKLLQDESILRETYEQKIPVLQTELEKERVMLITQRSCNETAMENLHHVTEKLKNSEDKLMAVEHCKMMLNEEVLAVHDSHDNMVVTLEKSLNESHTLKSQIVRLEEDNEKNVCTLHDEIRTLQKENEDLRVNQRELEKKLCEYLEKQEQAAQMATDQEGCQEGAHYALKLAQAHLEKRLAKYKRQYEELRAHIEETRESQQCRLWGQEDLQREIVDLKERLAMGAEEYKMKFIECRRLQKELRKIKKQSSSISSRGDSPEREVDKMQISTNMIRMSRSISSLRESFTQVEKDELPGGDDEAAWKKHMTTFSRLLEARNSRKHKYKLELTEQRARNDELVEVHRDELAKYSGLAHSQEELLTKIERESAQRCQILKDIIKKQRDEILHVELQRKIAEQSDIQGSPGQSTSRQRSSPSRPSPMEFRPISPVDIPAYNCEYYDVAPPSIPGPAPDVLPSAPREVAPIQECCVLDTNQHHPVKDELLQPLPAPIQPEVLPSAKLAAFRATEPDIPATHRDESASLGTKMPDFCPDSDQHPPPRSDTDLEEERFLDAAGEPQMICPVCCQSFPSETPQYLFEDHVEDHYGPVCPMCYKQFDEESDQIIYEKHVCSHFECH